ncbi:pancreatic lipase-related protein 2-like [Penaeus indicus]|uniref:pancreatic lipase-related protein 2-like n=1 Tax=Penaeus indicus TaxID=29960 RepID=UPI00300D637D
MTDSWLASIEQATWEGRKIVAMSPFVIFLIGLTMGSCSMGMEGYLLNEHLDLLFNDWKSQMSVLPESTLGDLEDVRFLLWTSGFPSFTFMMIRTPILHLSSSLFLSTLTEFLKISDSNVISVDYRTLVVSPWYNYAVENVYRVSNYTAATLDWMHEHVGFQAEDAHLVGHSLGAHTAGLTAKYINAGKVARVTEMGLRVIPYSAWNSLDRGSRGITSHDVNHSSIRTICT